MAALATLLGFCLVALPPDAPVRLAAAEVPQSLLSARRLSDQLRFEEALVEYQRYLTDPNRPLAERSRALLELGFIHLLLGDELNAKKRTFEALELDANLRAGPGAPQKQVDFLADAKRELEARPKLEVLPRSGEEPPQQVRVKVTDPQRRVQQLLLRHGFSPAGPFYGQPLRCPEAKGGAVCVGEIPAPASALSYNAWYYAEALDAQGNTLAQSASASSPLQLSVVQRSPWYKSPWVWGGGAALVVGIGVVVFATASASPR